MKTLPRLPLPPLDDLLAGLEAATAPLLGPAERAELAAACAAFRAGDGPRLHGLLATLDGASPAGYLPPFWRDTYLTNRLPLAIHQNVVGVMPPLPMAADLPLARWAALAIAANARFALLVRRGQHGPELLGGDALCARQYDWLFGAARVPGLARDEVVRHQADHVVVLWRGGVYVVAAIVGDAVRSVTALEADLTWIMAQPADPTEVATLTGAPRATWYVARRALAARPGNAEALRAVDAALFAVALAPDLPPGEGPLVRAALAGDPAERWCDKFVQLLIAPGGRLAASAEHSVIDGLTLASAATSARKAIPALAAAPGEPDGQPWPARLAWDVSAPVASAIAEVRAAHAATVDALAMETRVSKTPVAGVVPDAVVQLALQLAYARRHGRLASAYEPVSTRHFAEGRTEAVRPATAEALAFVRAALAGRADAAAFEAADRVHRVAVARANDGKGVERPLLALRALAAAHGLAPALFDTHAYREVLGRAPLSTSSVPPLPGVANFAFGPPPGVPDGYGVAYVIHPGEVAFAVSGAREAVGGFLDAVEAAVAEVAALARPGVPT